MDSETKNPIYPPHRRSEDEKLRKHVNHVLEDNAKLTAELLSSNRATIDEQHKRSRLV